MCNMLNVLFKVNTNVGRLSKKMKWELPMELVPTNNYK